MVIVVNLIWKSIIRQLFQEGRVLQIFSVDRFEGKPPKPENLPKLGIKFWQKFVKYFPNAGLVQTFNISDLTRIRGVGKRTGLTGTGPPTRMKGPPSLLYKYNIC